jgi:short-subunit dehydrogenase
VHRRAAQRGQIVNVRSLISLGSTPPMTGYSASKAAAHSLTRELRPVLGAEGITIHGVYPGGIDTHILVGIDAPKTRPAGVAEGILGGLAADQEDIFPDLNPGDVRGVVVQPQVVRARLLGRRVSGLIESVTSRARSTSYRREPFTKQESPMSKFELKDTTAIVTGASRGIGPYIAAALAKEGARVALVARSQPELAAVARELRDASSTVLEIPADVTSLDDRRRIVETVERELGQIDILVNNAGGDPQREFHRLSEKEIEAVLDLNLTSAVILTRLVLPAMLSRKQGHIVNVSSMAGRVGFPATEAYAAAKDGLIGITRVLRGDYRQRGVSASTLILGPVRDAGVGQRTTEEVGLELPPKAFTVSPADVGTATIRAIAEDKAEIAVLPGPGRIMRALIDRFPGLGPRLNRVSGAEATMQRVLEYREREAQLARGEGVAEAGSRC